ncbi:MAG: arginine deiminase family protein [Patescibacteria group bacterium]
MIHEPDDGLEKVIPNKAVEWLYEDIVYLERMRQEHGVFSKILGELLGNDAVLDVQDVLIEVFSEEVARERFAREICAIEGIEGSLRKILTDPDVPISPQAFVDIMLTGVVASESVALFPPVPNLIFTRDIAAVVGNQVIASTFAKQARRREALLMRYILYRYPFFKDAQKIEVIKTPGEFLLTEDEQKKMAVTIEGGDVMVWKPRHVFVGCGERTSPIAVRQIREQLFAANLIDSLTCVFTPKERSAMHLDTICTRISNDECVAYAPFVCEDGHEKQKMRVVHYESATSEGQKFSSLEKLIAAVTPEVTIIPCGGGEFPHDIREQWTDGCNFLALRPGFIVGYDRNTRTASELEKHGYRPYILSPYNVGSLMGELKELFEGNEKVVVLLESGELSRARGGPRCMSFPIARDN